MTQPSAPGRPRRPSRPGRLGLPPSASPPLSRILAVCLVRVLGPPPSAASCCAGAPKSSSRPPAAPVGAVLVPKRRPAVLIPKEAGTRPDCEHCFLGRVSGMSLSSSSVVYEGWMVRYGRRKIGRSFIHMRYFVLEAQLLSYYKRKPQHKMPKLPIKSLHIDGNCRVEDRGLKMHHGHMLYVLCVYNKREKHHHIAVLKPLPSFRPSFLPS